MSPIEEVKPRGKLVYCNMADTTKFMNNMFKSTRFYTGMVVDGKLEEISVHDLEQGDIIHFRPLIPVIGPSLVSGIISVVHAVTDEGWVVLGNANITPTQLQRMSDLHVSGRL